LFLSLTWRKAYGGLVEQEGNRRGEVSYLRLLHRAAMGMESEVEAALTLLLDADEVPTPERVKALLGDMEPTQAPEMAAPEVDLHEYDALMGAGLQEAI